MTISQKYYAEERIEAGAVLPWYRHSAPYAAVILSGVIEETSESGRRTLRSGDVAIHASYEAHADRVGCKDVAIINIALDGGLFVNASNGRIDDVDSFFNLCADGNRNDTADWLMQNMQRTKEAPADLPDMLARDLANGLDCSIGEWARKHGIRPESASRQFRRAYGLSPKQFRAAVRARGVLNKIARTADPLSELALQAGYADQAHMTRAVVAMTGRTPGSWRRSTGFNPAD